MAKTILGRIATIFDVVDTAGNDVLSAIASNTADFEDAIMIETATREKMNYIVTRNMDDYKLSPIKVLSPDEFIQILSVSRKENESFE